LTVQVLADVGNAQSGRIHLGVEVITPLLQFFLTVLVFDWMPWIVASDPAMAVEAKRNAVIEGTIAAIRFLNDMMAFDQSMYVLFAQTASSLVCQKGAFSDRQRKRHHQYFVGSSKDHKAKNRLICRRQERWVTQAKAIPLHRTV
jgi:hypothetical protein